MVSAIKAQEERVDTLISTGVLTLHVENVPSEASVLIVGRRDPSRIKIEVTHPWGSPLLHILIKGSDLDILSFTEKRHYRGRLGSPVFLTLLPGVLSPGLIWTLARAYPVLLPFYRAHSMRGDRISLTDVENKPIQRIDFYPDRQLPRRICFCREALSMSFCDFQRTDDIWYAREVRLIDENEAPKLDLEVRRMVFNRPVPNALFNQKAPADFEVLCLEEGKAEVSEKCLDFSLCHFP